MLVTCEGIDGSGKTTAARTLVAALREHGLDARAHVEPTTSFVGEAVRRALKEEVPPWTDALLFMADHAWHVEQVRAELAAGALVVSDRWSDSTYAYQGAALAAPGFDAVRWLQEAERPFDLRPDLTLLFDLAPEVALHRVGQRGATDKFEQLGFLTRVRENYLRLVREDPGRFVTIDATRPMADVADEALRAVMDRRLARTPSKQS